MRLAVTYQMAGYIDVPGNTIEEAMEEFNNNSDYYKLPTDAEYVDGSYELTTQDVEEMEAIVNW